MCVCMCVCVCVCVCSIYTIFILEPLLMYTYVLTYVKLHITFSILVYIMHVILCLFNTLCCRVGTLQISIIIILPLFTLATGYL